MVLVGGQVAVPFRLEQVSRQRALACEDQSGGCVCLCSDWMAVDHCPDGSYRLVQVLAHAVAGLPLLGKISGQPCCSLGWGEMGWDGMDWADGKKRADHARQSVWGLQEGKVFAWLGMQAKWDGISE